MAIQTSGLAETGREREMSVYLRGLVDTVLEEGNLDSAITLLDRLRNPVYKPYGTPRPHIRHVLYLALFPPPVTEAPASSAPILDTIPSSPSKFAAKYRQSFSLSPVIIGNAQNLLRVLVQTNSPESLSRALPNYGLTGIANLPEIEPIAEKDEDDGESELARLSRRIKDARSCWEIITENYIRRESIDDVPTNSGRKSKRRVAAETKVTFTRGESEHLPRPVADHAFPVLDSLVALFEKEELIMSSKHGIRFSPHFLAQVPASRTASGARWDVAAPLDAAFYCLQQPAHAILDLFVLQGAHYCRQLINLTNTIHLDLAMLLNAVSNRLLSTPPEVLQSIFTLLPRSATSLRFQIALCQSSLAHSSDGGPRSRPRPQVRNAPRPVPPSKDAVPSKDSSTLARKFPPLHFADILQAFSSPLSTSDPDPLVLPRKLHLKFFFVTAVGEMQENATPEERDPEWRRIVQSGELAKAIDVAFELPGKSSPVESHALAEDLKAMLSLVSTGWCQ
ncbi:hypothetical protein BC835DRAFT_1304585 [Cytidiella melzeri]|nr:hypothetical protein BC835DRAFT_1304585 [Cytidiella melzeri]